MSDCEVVDVLSKLPWNYVEQWKSEGWDLDTCDGLLDIQPIQTAGVFADKFGAVEWVISRAAEGSKPHLAALYLEGKPALVSSLRFWLPSNLLPMPAGVSCFTCRHQIGVACPIAGACRDSLTSPYHYHVGKSR